MVYKEFNRKILRGWELEGCIIEGVNIEMQEGKSKFEIYITQDNNNNKHYYYKFWGWDAYYYIEISLNEILNLF
jgi:hypothetical protein